MIRWSLTAGLLGVLGTWAGMVRLDGRESRRPPEVFWLLGMTAVFPAWLIACLGLLGRVSGSGRLPEMFVAVWWILSSAAALGGVILTDATVRRLRETGQPSPPAKYWLIGVGAFLPAWCLALSGLLWT